MTKTFSAIFENGVFRPVGPVDLPEHCQVRVEVQTMPQRVRLVGRLISVRADANAFDLALDDGEQIRFQWIGGDLAAIVGLNNERVLVLGTAVFGTTGNLLRIDSDDVTLSSDEGGFFSTVPRPVSGDFDLDDVLGEQSEKSGLSAIIGQWPGDESDEEIAAALRELS